MDQPNNPTNPAKTMLETVLEAALKAARPEIQRAIKDAVDVTLNAGSMSGIVSVMTVDKVFEEYGQSKLPWQAAQSLNEWVAEEMKAYIESNKPALQAKLKKLVEESWAKEEEAFNKRVLELAREGRGRLLDRIQETVRGRY